jgi:hypothetical protein
MDEEGSWRKAGSDELEELVEKALYKMIFHVLNNDNEKQIKIMQCNARILIIGYKNSRTSVMGTLFS